MYLQLSTVVAQDGPQITLTKKILPLPEINTSIISCPVIFRIWITAYKKDLLVCDYSLKQKMDGNWRSLKTGLRIHLTACMKHENVYQALHFFFKFMQIKIITVKKKVCKMQAHSGEKFRGGRIAGENRRWSTSQCLTSQVAQKTGEGAKVLVSKSLPPKCSCCSNINWRRCQWRAISMVHWKVP